MELHAYTRTISDLFSVKRKYIVPRFQREYSWTKEQVRELWEDVINNIRYGEQVQHEEYFVGALVLVGDDKSNVMQIVDGQQRLTTITILLSVLCDRFLELKKKNLAEAIYDNYIAGKDDDGKYYFKLENETPKPFFQKRIQHIEKDKTAPETDEEKTLLAAYADLSTYTGREALQRHFNSDNHLSDEVYETVLKAIRDQVVKYLKVIFITVAEEEEAYTIFETLNARGMNLSFVDLIKNKLFKELSGTHPDDDAKTAWKSIRNVMASRDGAGSLESFVRHWWISKYSYVSVDNVYKVFKKLWKEGKISPKEFISELNGDAKVYVKIAAPISEDFKQQEERRIYAALLSFKAFGVTQQRPFLISLFNARNKGVVRHSDFVDVLTFLEDFHFKFNAVCSMRPSGIEASYSRAARDLRHASNRNTAMEVINVLKQRFGERVPEESVFIEKFAGLRYVDGYTKDKKIIQYALARIEKSSLKTNELAPENISIEHILSQANCDEDYIGMVGNMLPLGQALNEEAGNRDVGEKIKMYQKSEFAMPREFVKQYAGDWFEDKIKDRTTYIAHLCYNNAAVYPD